MRPQELAEQVDDVVIVDVREPNEWEAGRIEGAVPIPVGHLEARLGELDRARRVVAVCRSGSRSGQAAERLREAGFDAENLEGGLLAWSEAGLGLTTPDGKAGTVAEPDSGGGDGPEADPEFQAAVVQLALDIQEHYGGREPSEEEVRAYLRDRMIGEGLSPEEADTVLARLTGEDSSAAD